MTIRESIRAQWETVKTRTAKEKLSYFWEYYGVKTVCVLIAAALLIAFAVSLITKKEYGYTGTFFGAVKQASADAYMTDFARAAGIDTEQFELTVQEFPNIRMDDAVTEENYQAMEKFAAMVAANMVENIAADADLFLYYSYLGYTVDLRTVLTPAQLSQLKPYLHYIDGKLLKEQENADEGLAFAYGDCPDSTDPGSMHEPIPVAIDLAAATEAFRTAYTFSSGTPIMGICASSENPAAALAFLQYAFGLTVTQAS